MDKSYGQKATANKVREHSTQTRDKLIVAARALMGERGWGRVTTRAVADRAGLPHGSVSYHFRGKEELLTDAALEAIDALFPMELLESLESLNELLQAMEDALRAPVAAEPLGVFVEVIRDR